MNLMFLFTLFLFALNMFFGVRALVRKDYGILTWLNLGIGLWMAYDVVRILPTVQ